MIPDAYYKDIYTIDYDKLKRTGIKNIFFDVDNTIITYEENIPSKELVDFINKLKKEFNIEVISNSKSKRVLKIINKLEISGYYFSMKPLKKNYKKIMKKYKKEECIFIGDQFMTDVIGAKRNDLKIILVDRISKNEPLFTRFWRFFEKKKVNKLNKNNKFCWYKYYDNIV